MLTMSAGPLALSRAVRAGALGYVVKGASGEELLGAIRAVAGGGLAFGGAAARLVEQLVGAGAAQTPFPELTTREREVLAALGAGLTNAELAQQLGLTPKTVRNYVSTLQAKLGVADRAKLIVLARDGGLG